MVESSWNKVIGVLVILFGIFGLINHADDIFHPYKEAEMTDASSHFLTSYVDKVQSELGSKYEVSAEAIIKIDGFEQSATSKAYVLSEESIKEIEDATRKAEEYLKDIRTEPVDEHIEWVEIPYSLISIVIILGGFLMMGENKNKYKVFYGGLLSAVVYDVVMMATSSYSVWGMAIFINLLFCLIIFTANRHSNKVVATG